MSSPQIASFNRARPWRAASVAAALGLGVALAGASVAVAAAASPGTTGRSGAAVPSGFRGASMSWLTPERALALGTAPCTTKADGGSSMPTGCTYVVGTTDAGAAWTLAGPVTAPLSNGVRNVALVSAAVAWLYQPQLWLSTDSGKVWKKTAIPGNEQQVVSLVGNASETYAMVSACGQTGGLCESKPYTVWRTSTAKPGTWTKLATDLAPPSGLFDIDGGLSIYGTTVYAFASFSNSEGGDVHNALEVSTLGGSFTNRKAPCTTSGEVPQNLLQAVATSKTTVALLCQGPPSVGHSSKPVFYSTDAGVKFVPAGAPGTGGILAQLAASPAPSRNLAVSSASGASYIDINDTGKTTWTRVVNEPDGGQG
ncbi:MAG TPA: hypothetical protein VGP46_09380, partial [Acidimicrobiales bacterium]|nr:hypothetical protein [Acidimicrobiales bacterium]